MRIFFTTVDIVLFSIGLSDVFFMQMGIKNDNTKFI